MSQPLSTETIYNKQAASWSRSEKILLSDFTARPRVIEALGDISGANVLDLGCGEGYVSRMLLNRSAGSVFGVDASSEMITQAKKSAAKEKLPNSHYAVGNAVTYTDFPTTKFDHAIAVFLFNYLKIEEMTEVMAKVKNLLKAGGAFIFTVPHPCLPFMKEEAPPFYFEHDGKSYLDGIDQTFEGEIWRRDGVPVSVRCVHKTFSHYFDALKLAGFQSLPEVKELSVTKEHLKLDPDFFAPLEGYPLHVLFKVQTND
ncbi:class I SAM-dependent methyltransferase [Microbulbifer sp. OS29]|uniref:Class I SAM-dependent methyltransferase n=1 Tax=Microbulbifer okhotskensis TaxID=2926617 RepID=A0A9X2EMU1_9GAMM|nr:class I SAM-dependent methyltransferase [Microbulbifer okhotskensis]MCO1334010.1 class I SAM-dependent methyltransferase [Microbulbifer okhotskensis]